MESRLRLWCPRCNDTTPTLRQVRFGTHCALRNGVLIGVVSDIHSNVDALVSVLEALKAEGVHDVVSLGDIVGYNGFPMETVMALQRAKVASVLGNHDLMVLGRLPLEGCGPRARRAVEWTATELSPAERAYLE